MAHYIAPQIIPQWAVTHLGKRVRFVEDYDFYGDGSHIIKAGAEATLDAIQVGTQDPEAVVYFGSDNSLLYNPSISIVAPSN